MKFSELKASVCFYHICKTLGGSWKALGSLLSLLVSLIPSHYLQSQKDACGSFLPCGTSPVIGKLSQRETSLRLVYATMSWLVLSLTADMKSHINYASKREQLSPFITFIQFWIIFEISLQSIGVRYGIPMLTYVVICLVCLFPLSFPIPSSPV